MAFPRKRRGGRGVIRQPGQMNGTEKKYSLHLEALKQEGEILWYDFDAIKFRLAPKTFYTPDFLVMKEDGILEVHEVKGTSKGKPFVEDDAAVKIKVAAEKFPIHFKMVWHVRNEGWKVRDY